MSVSVKTQVMVAFGVSLPCMLTCGTQYAVSAWSPQLKSELNCTQSAIEEVGELGNLGAYAGPLSGALVYAMPEWAVCLVCLCCTLVGYVLMALTVASKAGSVLWPLRNSLSLGIMFAFTGFGSSTIYCLLLAVNLQNMPLHRRGSAVAVLACLLGLSASVFTLLYNDVLHSDVVGILLTMGIAVCVACVLTAVFVRRYDPIAAWGDAAVGEDGSPPLASLQPVNGAHQPTALCLDSSRGSTSASGTVRVRKLSSDYQQMILVDEDADEPEPTPEPTVHLHPIHRHSLPKDLNAYGSSANSPSHLSSSPAHSSSPSDEPSLNGEAHRMWLVRNQERDQIARQMRTCGGGLCGRIFGAIIYLSQNRSYWLLLSIFFLQAGVGLMLINNVGHIVQSLNGGVQDGGWTTLLILILSLANGMGRLLMGASDYTSARKGWWLCGCCALMSLSHFSLAYLLVTKSSVVWGIVGVGLSYGGLWSIMPIVISDNFGPVNFSMNLGWISFVSGFGGMLFNACAGVWYDQHTEPGQTNCVGPKCYRTAFIFAGCGAALAMLISLLVIPVTQRGKKNFKLISL